MGATHEVTLYRRLAWRLDILALAFEVLLLRSLVGYSTQQEFLHQDDFPLLLPDLVTELSVNL